MAKEDLILKDRGRGRIWLVIRNGIVTGAMGSEPERYVGLTIDQARHLARYGGRRGR